MTTSNIYSDGELPSGFARRLFHDYASLSKEDAKRLAYNLQIHIATLQRQAELAGRVEELESIMTSILELHHSLSSPIAMSTLDLLNEQIQQRILKLLGRQD